jgi:hypothetical protein
MNAISSLFISPRFAILSLVVSLLLLSGCAPQPPEEKLATAHKAVLDARKAGADTLARSELSYAQDHLKEAIEGLNNEKRYLGPFRKYDYISGLLDTVIMSAHAAEESTAVRKVHASAIKTR